jgi:hypothetical protein
MLYILHSLLFIQCISAVGIELAAKVVLRCGESGPAAIVVLRPLPTSLNDSRSLPGITKSAMTPKIIESFGKSHRQTDSAN